MKQLFKYYTTMLMVVNVSNIALLTKILCGSSRMWILNGMNRKVNVVDIILTKIKVMYNRRELL